MDQKWNTLAIYQAASPYTGTGSKFQHSCYKEELWLRRPNAYGVGLPIQGSWAGGH